MAAAPVFSRFRIDGLRGDRRIDATIVDNTLILVGENGSGKTTFLRIMFYFLSARWSTLAQFEFGAITATINSIDYVITHDDIDGLTTRVDERVLSRLPPSQRRRFAELVELGRLVEADALISQYGYRQNMNSAVRQQELFKVRGEKEEHLFQMQESISGAIQSQILYLPTYRRIERELSSILQGIDPDDPRRPPISRQAEDGNDYVELVEFGMNDVKRSINKVLEDIRSFQLQGTNRLSLSYLGDVVSQAYKSVDRHEIEKVSDESIDSVLDRIDNTILGRENKARLRTIVLSARNTSNIPTEYEQILYHYFSKLIRFQQELQVRERSISDFCQLCSTYIVDKSFLYVSGQASLRIESKESGAEIPLSELSSGEKQIVSLFCHLYLSGREKYFVLIDEPELSLSVPWQRRFLRDIREGAFCSGLVAVTHSPFIYDNELRRHTRAMGQFVQGPDWGNLS